MLALLGESALRSLVLGGAVWIGLKILRVRNPHVHMTSWAMVLFASLSMPVLMHQITVVIPTNPIHSQTLGNVSASETSLPVSQHSPRSPPPLEQTIAKSSRSEISQVNWWALGTALYTVVAAVLLLRLATGIYLTWRLARASQPIDERFGAASDVRVSDIVGVPVTFGSTIILPPECFEWDLTKRRAVLAHEGSHVARGDFYLLLLASLNRAVFWFSPFAWWQLARLAELAEIISDDTALEYLDDRLSYAEILLELAGNVQRAPAGLAMARACTVRRRVERILAATQAPARMSWRKRMLTAAAITPVVAMSAGTIAYSTTPAPTRAVARAVITSGAQSDAVGFYLVSPTSIFSILREGDSVFAQLTGQRKLQIFPESDGKFSYNAVSGRIVFAAGGDGWPAELVLHQNGRDVRAARLAGVAFKDHLGQRFDANLDSYIGWYELSPSRALAITRENDRLFVQETGRPRFEVIAQGARDYFSSSHGALIVFLGNGEETVFELLLQEPTTGARRAIRVDIPRAKAIEEAFARRINEVPDRFKDQTPAPGGKDAILRGIEDMQRGAPNYDRMGLQLATRVRAQASELQAMFKALGSVESIFFRGVGPGGYDIYGMKFAKGFAEFRLLLGVDGKIDDVIFRPDGDETPGGVVACTEESATKTPASTAPIRLLLYNGSGRDIYPYALDPQGKRKPHRAIGDDTSSSILTYVNSPLVVADASGQCLEIVLPGQRTRYHVVEASRAGNITERSLSQRTTPIAGSEGILRQYIEALSRGEPNYQGMTPEVAAETRQQLLLNQAILVRLGELRAVSFRGVSALGSDVYLAHFANGSAEWRIGLVKDGKIGRIALGPQY